MKQYKRVGFNRVIKFATKLYEPRPVSRLKNPLHCRIFNPLLPSQDLSKLGRRVEDCIIIDNSPTSYIFHPDYAIPVSSWFDDDTDTELLDLIPFFEVLQDTPVSYFSHIPFMGFLYKSSSGYFFWQNRRIRVSI